MRTALTVKDPVRAAAPWSEVLFVCSKCARRNDRDAELPLRKWLKRELAERGLKKQVRVVEAGCLDLCPKKGVTLALGSELAASDQKKLRVHRRGDDREALIEWVTRGRQ